MKTANRFHDISAGHRVHNHESKCQHLHGHNYRIHFEVTAPELDAVGRVMDFGVIKEKLCMWLEDNWDHKFLAWEQDPFMRRIVDLVEVWDPAVVASEIHPAADMLNGSIVWVPFNPTAENMAQYLVEVIGPKQLEGTGCTLIKVIVEETRKCSTSFTKE
jgi:6-pyruvoyltetrahydropterin/6-carboxytetrahydropterin synthase